MIAEWVSDFSEIMDFIRLFTTTYLKKSSHAKKMALWCITPAEIWVFEVKIAS